MRTEIGIRKEISSLESFIEREKSHLISGFRHGSFHHPAFRIKEYERQLLRANEELKVIELLTLHS